MVSFRSFLTALAIANTAAAGAFPRGAPADPCAGIIVKEVAAILKLLHASSFCSALNHISTKTVISTSLTTSIAGTISSLTVPTTITTIVPYSPTTTTVQVSTETVIIPVESDITVTLTESPTITATSLTTKTQVDIFYTNSLNKRDLERKAAAAVDERGILQIPKEFAKYGLPLLSQGCSCYVTTPTVTSTTILSAVSSSTAISTTSSTSTVVITETFIVTQTVQSVVTYDSTSFSTATFQTTVTQNVLTTVPATTTVHVASTMSALYTQVFSSNGCAYNHYIITAVQTNSPATFDLGLQQCALLCTQNGPNVCKMFFFFEVPTSRFRFTCRQDDIPYDPQYIQCNLPFAAGAVVYGRV